MRYLIKKKKILLKETKKKYQKASKNENYYPKNKT